MALHNFIRTSGIVDRDFDRCDRNENYVPPEASASQPRTRQTPARDEYAMMNAFRDSIALDLLNRSWQLERCTSNITCVSDLYGWGQLSCVLELFNNCTIKCNIWLFVNTAGHAANASSSNGEQQQVLAAAGRASSSNKPSILWQLMDQIVH